MSGENKGVRQLLALSAHASLLCLSPRRTKKLVRFTFALHSCSPQLRRSNRKHRACRGGRRSSVAASRISPSQTRSPPAAPGSSARAWQSTHESSAGAPGAASPSLPPPSACCAGTLYGGDPCLASAVVARLAQRNV